MAQIVAGFGVPHTPIFPHFVKRDGPDCEIAKLFCAQKNELAATRPDLIVMFDTDHLNTFFLDDLPIFAICRGLQILNVYHGGTLVQHLEDVAHHDPEKDDPSGPAHEVAFVPHSKLAQIAGAPSWQVNSRHHQAVLKLGHNLHIAARDAEDGTVEGIERQDKRYVVAVQWHPEDQTRKHPEQLRLFESFAPVSASTIGLKIRGGINRISVPSAACAPSTSWQPNDQSPPLTIT